VAPRAARRYQRRAERSDARTRGRIRVLDANFLIDYLSGIQATREYYAANGGDDETWIIPAPAYAETIVGVGNHPDGDVDETIAALGWGEVVSVDDDLAETAARIADEIEPGGPYLDGVDGLVAAVGREWGAPVVSADSDLTHEETKRVVAVEEYR
jgi:predicted nucleic acid-binding protein